MKSDLSVYILANFYFCFIWSTIYWAFFFLWILSCLSYCKKNQFQQVPAQEFYQRGRPRKKRLQGFSFWHSLSVKSFSFPAFSNHLKALHFTHSTSPNIHSLHRYFHTKIICMYFHYFIPSWHLLHLSYTNFHLHPHDCCATFHTHVSEDDPLPYILLYL